MQIEISVRDLVEFILRSGDIDNRGGASRESAMLEGARLHRKIQSRMGTDYKAEVKMSHVIYGDKYDILIEGRADGVIESPGSERIIIDEIKTTYRDLSRIEEPEKVHLAQAKCYAYFCALSKGVSQIGVRMTYCNIKSEAIRYFHENYTLKQLEKWFDGIISEYRKWADHDYEWGITRSESIKKIVFPFPYRDGQKELIGYVYRTICEEKKLFLEAPTGVGKTISVIYPSIKAVGERKADKLFYLTAKNVTGSVARNTFSLLEEQGLKFKRITLTAKEKMCPLDECICNPEGCPFAKGHYDRINEAIYSYIRKEDSFDRDSMLSHALEYEVCPFEMQLDLSTFADAIICDYNYLFDPYVSLKRYFSEGIRGKYIFMADEAHNLVERGREMYSASLYKEDFLELKALVKGYSPVLSRDAERCNRIMLDLKKNFPDDKEYMLIPPSASDLIGALERLQGNMGTYLEDNDKSPIKEELLPFYFKVSAYLDTYDRIDPKHYITYVSYTYDGPDERDEKFMIKEFCVDPGRELKACMDKGIASILFSATFLPIQYYKKLLGGVKEDYEVYANSTFPPENRLVLIGNEVTSRYTKRGPSQYKNIALYIYSVISAKPGKYMVFFPSHQFLKEVRQAYLDMYADEEDIEVISQESVMFERERERFLEAFLSDNTADLSDVIKMKIEPEEDEDLGTKVPETLLGFCVMGGVFSEGIDLKKDALIGVIVVGTGLPQIGAERSILKNHFDNMGENGFDYAYRFPGMNKVLQASGRVIRTHEDTGVIVLLDDRFEELNYKRLFPREWKNIKTVSINGAGIKTAEFWENLE
ncbi:MAG TPA: helicase [Lachnospiraceae bacterium]|nr:helicase [Lachnospiraceae bacterium]